MPIVQIVCILLLRVILERTSSSILCLYFVFIRKTQAYRIFQKLCDLRLKAEESRTLEEFFLFASQIDSTQSQLAAQFFTESEVTQIIRRVTRGLKVLFWLILDTILCGSKVSLLSIALLVEVTVLIVLE